MNLHLLSVFAAMVNFGAAGVNGWLWIHGKNRALAWAANFPCAIISFTLAMTLLIGGLR